MTRAILIVASLMVLTCCAPAQAALSVFPADGLARVRRHDTVFSTTPASIKAARNEYEPFQIVVRAGGEGLKGVNVEASDLRGEDGHVIDRRHITLYREHYVEVTQPSPKSKEGAGWYPDALIPIVNPPDGRPLKNGRFVGAPFEVEPKANQPVWVDVFVPKDAVPGTYSGTVTVTAQGQKAVRLPVRLTVWNFTLPDAPSMRSNFGDFDNRVAAAHKVGGKSKEFRE